MIYVSKISCSWRTVKPKYKGIQYEDMEQLMSMQGHILGISMQEVFDRMTFFDEPWESAIALPAGSKKFYWEYEGRNYPTLDNLAKTMRIDSMLLRRALVNDGNLITCVRRLTCAGTEELPNPFTSMGRLYKTLDDVRRDYHTTYEDECRLLEGELKKPIIRLGSKEYWLAETIREEYKVPKSLFKLNWELGFPLDACLYVDGFVIGGIQYPSLHKYLVANDYLPEHIEMHSQQVYRGLEMGNQTKSKYVTPIDVLKEVIKVLKEYQKVAWRPESRYPMMVDGYKVCSLMDLSKVLRIRKRILENRLLSKGTPEELLAPLDSVNGIPEPVFLVKGKSYPSIAAVARDFGVSAYLISKYKTGPDLTDAVIAARRDKALMDEKAEELAMRNEFFKEHRIVDMVLYGDTVSGGHIYKIKFQDDPIWYLHTLQTLESHWEPEGIRIPL